MIKVIPLWNALKTSNQILGASMPEAEKAQKVEKDIRAALDKGLKILDEEVKSGFRMKFDYVTEAIQQCESV